MENLIGRTRGSQCKKSKVKGSVNINKIKDLKKAKKKKLFHRCLWRLGELDGNEDTTFTSSSSPGNLTLTLTLSFLYHILLTNYGIIAHDI